MVDEEGGISSFGSFASRYQADLEIIYQKYNRAFEDGTLESEELLLSNLECYEDDDDDDVSENESDDGWESDSSGPTDWDNETPIVNASKPVTNLNNAMCLKTLNSNSKDPGYPLSSTVVGDLDADSDFKVDPNLSPVAHPDISDIPRFKAQDVVKGIAIKPPDNIKAINSVVPHSKRVKVLTSTQLEATESTSPTRLPDGKEKVSYVNNSNDDLLHSRGCSQSSLAIHEKNGSIMAKDGSPPSSFLKAILNTRNRIANILVDAVLSCQKGNPNEGVSYNSLSSDSNFTASTVHSISKESLFLPEKLLKEFNTHLTADIMNDNPLYGQPKRGTLHLNYPSGSSSISKNSRVIIRPNGTGPKKRTVSLLASRKTIKVNPSLQLPTNNSITLARNSSSNNKILAVPQLSTNSQKIVKAGAVLPGKALKSIDSGRPTQVVSTKAVLGLSSCFPPSGKLEFTMSNGSHKQSECLESLLYRELSFNGRCNRLPLVKHSFLSSPLKAQDPSSKKRRSIPLQTKCFPITENEGRCHSEHVMTRQDRPENQTNKHGRQKCQTPREKAVPGKDTTKSPKRSFEDVLKATSLKRVCHRSDGMDQKEATYPRLKRKSEGRAETPQSFKRQRVASNNEKRLVVNECGSNILKPGVQTRSRGTQKLCLDKIGQSSSAVGKISLGYDKQEFENKNRGYYQKNMTARNDLPKAFQKEGPKQDGTRKDQKPSGSGRDKASDPVKGGSSESKESNKRCSCRCQSKDESDEENGCHSNRRSTKSRAPQLQCLHATISARPIKSLSSNNYRKGYCTNTVALKQELEQIDDPSPVEYSNATRRSNCRNANKLQLSAKKSCDKNDFDNLVKMDGSAKQHTSSDRFCSASHRTDGRRHEKSPRRLYHCSRKDSTREKRRSNRQRDDSPVSRNPSREKYHPLLEEKRLVTPPNKRLVANSCKCEVMQSSDCPSCHKVCKHINRRDKLRVDRGACNPEYCNKQVCLACGKFSMQDSVDLSVSAISRTGR